MAHAGLWTLALVVACSPDVDQLDDPSTRDAGVRDGDTAGDAPGDGAPPSDGAQTATLCDEARAHSDFAWIETNVLVPSCATAMCHTGANAEVGLRLDAGEAYANLVNKGSSTQAGWVRVVPGSPSTSYLVVALGRADGPPPRDGFMPLGADPLCTEIHEAIERWITAGAPR
jgi:hypothetical protein